MSGRAPHEVDDAFLRAWSLPALDGAGDKESRGRVVVVAGSREMPGAAVLAATAALRAGAGKLLIATPASAAPSVALAMPEARVIALPETAHGGPTLECLSRLEPFADSTSAVLIGPGMIDAEATLAVVERLLPMFTGATTVLDALALDCVHAEQRFAQPVIMTPHAGETAHLTGVDKDDILARPLETALRQAHAWNAVVAVKGALTCIAAPDGTAWRHEASIPGLGTSGSGDVLAGIVAGLAARGAPPAQATVWGVALHARAGKALARSHGDVGYLARELPGEIPALMHGLSSAS